MAASRAAELLAADGPDKPFLDILLLGGSNLLAVGAYGIAVQSEDGGATWQYVADRFDDPRGLHIYHLARAGKTLFAAGEQGLFLVAPDGNRFEPVQTPYEGTFFGVLTTGDTILAYGLRGTLLRSEDGGAHWAKIPTPTEAGLVASLLLPDGRIVLSAMSGEILVSEDQGRSVHAAERRLPIPVTALAATGSFLILGTPDGTRRLPISILRNNA